MLFSDCDSTVVWTLSGIVSNALGRLLRVLTKRFDQQDLRNYFGKSPTSTPKKEGLKERKQAKSVEDGEPQPTVSKRPRRAAQRGSIASEKSVPKENDATYAEKAEARSDSGSGSDEVEVTEIKRRRKGSAAQVPSRVAKANQQPIKYGEPLPTIKREVHIERHLPVL